MATVEDLDEYIRMCKALMRVYEKEKQKRKEKKNIHKDIDEKTKIG